jgi:hypothetical protein
MSVHQVVHVLSNLVIHDRVVLGVLCGVLHMLVAKNEELNCFGGDDHLSIERNGVGVLDDE